MSIDDAYKLLNTLITSFVAAGGLGFINYLILEKLDILRNEKNRHDEKLLFILLFSIINYTLFLLMSIQLAQLAFAIRTYVCYNKYINIQG